MQSLAGELATSSLSRLELEQDTRTDSRADKGTLTLKPYGKQTIFVYNQVSRGPLSHHPLSASPCHPCHPCPRLCL
jgi:hypothetical protein